MESLYFLIPLSLLILALVVVIFIWAVNSGQYDDIDREGERILFEDDVRLAKQQSVAKDVPPESDDKNDDNPERG
ncbi:MAG: cbb3-type cytochrome oxidase assembly protein CcoS [Porticoccaceae bacterium]|nr:cbb3-type cytochrome oxidase assembly protein CcoS [Porticoccaceae bacterium]